MSSKLAEARGLAQSLYLSYPQFNNTETQKKLIKMEEQSDSMVNLIRLESDAAATFAEWIKEDISFLRQTMF